ncbi:MAG: hypothetical protein Q4B86_08225 [Eubacteriales bacterium]|nr:hypothetical protein [Eubacteriales bacterium]
MHSTNKKPASQKKKNNNKILYDARGVRVQNKGFSNRIKKVLLFYVLPYLVLNGIILVLVTAKPKIELKVNETNDYETTTATFTIKSLLPIKELEVSLESAPVKFEKTSGSQYTAVLDKNGTLYIEATSLNGMREVNYADVNVLDDTAPNIDESSCKLSGDELSFTISDSQSGVDFDSIYGIKSNGKEIRPTKTNPKTGLVTIPILNSENTNDLDLEIRVSDKVGNTRSANISINDKTVVSDNNEEDTDTDTE